MEIRMPGVLAILLLRVAPASAQFDRHVKGLGIGQRRGLSHAKIASGSKGGRSARM